MHLGGCFQATAVLSLTLITSAKFKLHQRKKIIKKPLPKFIVLLQYVGNYLIWQLTPLTNYNTASYLTCPLLTNSLFLLTALLASQSILPTNFFLWRCQFMSLLKTTECFYGISLLNVVSNLPLNTPAGLSRWRQTDTHTHSHVTFLHLLWIYYKANNG